MAGRMIGMTTSRSVRKLRAPSVSDASSRLRSSWLRRRARRGCRPACCGRRRQTPGPSRAELHRGDVEGQDVGDADHGAGDGEAHHGEELKGCLAGKFCRDNSQAVNSPIPAVSGIAMIASSSVVMNDSPGRATRGTSRRRHT